MPPAQTVRVKICVAMWLRWYLSAVALASHITGAEPDWQKVEGWIRRGVKAKVVT